MKFKFIVSKSANFFFFIDNLSEWNIYCRKNYNQEWIKQFDKLTAKEKSALKKYRLLMQHYGINATYKKIRKTFYEERLNDLKLVIKKLEKIINKKDFNDIQETFIALQPRFDKIWKKHQILLNNNKKIISEDYKTRKNKLHLIYSKLANFYGNQQRNQYIDAYLIICPIKNYQGGKVIDKNIISIEINKLDYKNKIRLMNVWFLIIHELTHAIFENQKYKNWIKKFAEKQPSINSKLVKKHNARYVLREMITAIATLSADILLNEKDKNILQQRFKEGLVNFQPDDLNTFKQFTKQALKNITEKYFSSKKKIDKYFLKLCWELIKDYPKNLLESIKKAVNSLH